MYLLKRYALLLISLSGCLLVYQAGATPSPAHVLPDTPKNIFIKTVCSKPVVYAGEMFTVKYLLFSSTSVIDPETDVDLNFKYCYQEQYPSEPAQHTEKINNKDYNVVTLKQYLVIASNTGRLDFPQLGINLKISAPVKSNDFFGQEDFVSKKLLSDAASVQVIPMPAQPDTATFIDAIGKFQISGFYKANPKTPGMISFHLTMAGMGNTRMATFNTPKLPDGIDVYDPATTRHDTLTRDGINTKLEYSFQLVANYRGDYQAPQLTFNYFDPNERKYISYISPGYHWHVVAGPQMPKIKNAAQRRPADVFVKKDMNDESGADFYYPKPYVLLLIAGLILAAYGYNLTWINRLIAARLKSSKSKKPRSNALRNIKKLMASPPDIENDIFSKRLVAIFYQYLGEKFSWDSDEISRTGFDGQMLYAENKQLANQQIALFLDIQTLLRFGPSKELGFDKQQYCRQLVSIIKTIDRGQHA